MESGPGFSLFAAGWRHPAMNMGSMGMDLTQAAYRYNQNMMEYYTCKTSKFQMVTSIKYQGRTFICFQMNSFATIYSVYSNLRRPYHKMTDLKYCKQNNKTIILMLISG